MQPKMGGKLLLKLNMDTRPIANKYREGKMKSTLKRKLRVRETVSREAHEISNAGEKFRCQVCGRVWLQIRRTVLCTFCASSIALFLPVRQRVFGVGDTYQRKVASLGLCYSLW